MSAVSNSLDRLRELTIVEACEAIDAVFAVHTAYVIHLCGICDYSSQGDVRLCAILRQSLGVENAHGSCA